MRTHLKDFAAAYETMNRWGKINAGGQMLYVGTENFPFPNSAAAEFIRAVVFQH